MLVEISWKGTFGKQVCVWRYANWNWKAEKLEKSESWLFPTVLPGCWAAILQLCRLRCADAAADSKIVHSNTFIRISRRHQTNISHSSSLVLFGHRILSHGCDVISEETQILVEDQWLKVKHTFIQRIFSDGQDGHRPADTSVIQSPVFTWWHHRCHLHWTYKFFTNTQMILWQEEWIQLTSD